jgi:hypothetical protein
MEQIPTFIQEKLLWWFFGISRHGFRQLVKVLLATNYQAFLKGQLLLIRQMSYDATSIETTMNRMIISRVKSFMALQVWYAKSKQQSSIPKAK